MSSPCTPPGTAPGISRNWAAQLLSSPRNAHIGAEVGAAGGGRHTVTSMGNDTTTATATTTTEAGATTAVGLLEGRGHWKGKRLQLTDPEVVERLRRKSLSPSTSKIFTKDCPTRWAVEKLAGEGEENPFAATFTGTCVHAVLEAITVAPPAKRTPAFFDRLVLEMSDVIFPLEADATDDEVAEQQMTKARWTAEMAEAGRGYFGMEDVSEIVIADLDMPELPVSKPTDPSTLEGAAVAVAERHRDAFLGEAGFTHIPGIELDCSNVVIGGVPSGGFVDRVTQIGTAPDGTPLLKVEDYKSGKLPRKGDETVHDQLRIYVLMLEELTGIRPVAARLIYTRFGEFIDVDVSDEALDDALARHQDAWAAHCKQLGKEGAGKANLATKVSALCGWCPAVNSCPAAAAADKGPSPKVTDGRFFTVEDLGLYDEEELAAREEEAAETAEDAPREGVSAHMEGDDPYLEGDPMTATATKARKKVSTSTGRTEAMLSDGTINANSYGASTLFGTASLAAEHLHERGEAELIGAALEPLANLFNMALCKAQKEWVGDTDPVLGERTRLSGLLRTCLQLDPVPLVADGEEIEAWLESTVRRMLRMVAVAESLADDAVNGPKIDDPWFDLADAIAGEDPAAADADAEPDEDYDEAPETEPETDEQADPETDEEGPEPEYFDDGAYLEEEPRGRRRR